MGSRSLWALRALGLSGLSGLSRLSGLNKFMGSLALGLMGSWAHGLLGSWAHGLLDSWAHGLLVSWALGLLGSRALGLIDSRAHGPSRLWAVFSNNEQLLWPGIQTYNLVLKQSSFSRVRTKWTLFSLVTLVNTFFKVCIYKNSFKKKF
jgi:hypothetical protein